MGVANRFIQKTYRPFTCLIALLVSGLLFFGLRAQELSVSPEPGFYSQTQMLVFETDQPDVKIFYTLDGSVPDENSIPYEGPIELRNREGEPNVISEIPTNPLGPDHPYRENWIPPQGEVFKIHVLRAVGILPDGSRGPEWKGSFIIHPEGVDRYSVPVFSLITDPDNFFGFEEGIYVPGINNGNYYGRGREWEREVHLEFFENDGSLVLAQDVGVRIHGGTSRNRPRKSLRLYARSDYGNTWFDYAFFPDKEVTRYKRFLLRNSGNDWSESIFRDAFIQSLAKENTSLDIQYSRPAVVFINGEYWGVHNIRDRLDDRYLQTHYDLDRERVSILGGSGNPVDGSEEGVQDYQQMRFFILNEDMNEADHFEQASMMMDMDNYIDYQILQIYCRNTDWPGNNIDYWKYMDGDLSQTKESRKDGRWRWLVYDLDFGFGLNFDYVYIYGAPHGENNAFHNTLAFALEPNGPSWPNPPWSTRMFRNLMESQTFRELFVTRFADHLNTTFEPFRILESLDLFTETYEEEMEEHIQRWTEPEYDHWRSDLSTMRTFGLLRAPILRNHLNNTLELGGTSPLTVDVNIPVGGTIKVNTITLSPAHAGVYEPIFPWEGVYFQTVPVQLIALAEVGYEFSHWEGDFQSDSDTLNFYPTEAFTAVAHFVRGEEFSGDSMNPPAHKLLEEDYYFDFWDSIEPEGSFPRHMVLQQSDLNDPGLSAEMTHPYHIPYTDAENNEYHNNDQDKIGFPYSLTGRTRIDGLGPEGIAFINTGRGRDLGAALLAVNTEGVAGVLIDWEAQTLNANSRVYHLRLQYRVGLQGEWTDVTDDSGEAVEYERQEHTIPTEFKNLRLPQEALGHPYVQLRWKYYFTGLRLTQEFGSRDRIRLDNIHVRKLTTATGDVEKVETVKLFQNFPNPHAGYTQIEFEIPSAARVKMELFDGTGRRVTTLLDEVKFAGNHSLALDLSGLSAGVYFYRLTAMGEQRVKRMVIIK
nr:CotH kinase family protein [Saprospiraceae bacterium]